MSELDIEDTKPVAVVDDVVCATLKSTKVSVTIGHITYIGPPDTMSTNIKAACTLDKRDEAAILLLAKNAGTATVKAEDSGTIK